MTKQAQQQPAPLARHTPGPWRPVTDAQGTCGLLHPTLAGVAVAWFSSTFNPADGYVDEREQPLGRPEREANARLIAAAPDLLAVLEMYVADDYERGGTTGKAAILNARRLAAQIAIAKARGEGGAR